MSVKPKDYKHTINLPQTAFSMKADLVHREPEILNQWKAEGLYSAIRSRSNGRKKYILHDGPPYANGRIHIGHALNKILKDIIVKYKTMAGFDALYIPGWDCHGLPIEHQCLKEMGKRKEEVERASFRKEARKYAERFISLQRDEFIRLGIYGEWEHPYLTMDYQYQAAIAGSFMKLFEAGFIEQRLKPVPWCWDCETALADAELEYEDKTSKSVYVAFKLDSSSFESSFQKLIGNKTAHLLIWTTTPWTLPANVGVAFHPQLHYVAAQTDQGIFVFAEDLLEPLKTKLGWQEAKILTRFPGRHLPFQNAIRPFSEKVSKAILADYVSAVGGTGIVHIAPGHGEEDYEYGYLQNKLEILSPVDQRGRFTEAFPFAEGIHVFKANGKIIEHLKEKKDLLHQEDVRHSYPHCWRCKNPIIFRATPQWFLKIDHQNLRQTMVQTIQNKIQFTPDWGKNRIGSMVESRPDWCLSRQRYWGVPIPIIRCSTCPDAFFVSQSKEKIVSLFQKESADSWFVHAASDFLPPGFKCPKCGESDFKKEEDIIDVWFDSGVSHQAVLKQKPELNFPSDLYLEGSDQHRGWFQSSLTTGVALEGCSPFRGVLTHGFVVDGEGKKMSKSAGNVVSPQDVMKEFGADILRLWVSSCDYQFDVRLSKEILKQLTDSYRKIRNTFRFMLGNLHQFNVQEDYVPSDQLHPLDRWAIERADQLVVKTDQAYGQFDFHAVFQNLYDFCSLDLSSYYFDILKDTLYTAAKKAPTRRSAQTGLFEVLGRLTRLFAPILAFTTEEVWRAFPPAGGNSVSVHQADLILSKETGASDQDQNTFLIWEQIRKIRDTIMPSLEKKRAAGLIGSSLDAKIYLKSKDPKTAEILKTQMPDLRRIFIVSQIEWMEGAREGSEDLDGPFQLTISVEKADGKKCERCWNYSLRVGESQEHPTLCERCVETLKIGDFNS